MEETICAGWLTKSPPEKFVKILKGPRFTLTQKLIKAKWRRRYFVLYKPAGSLPGEYALDYYTDDQRRRRKGEISLGECERIQSSLESSYYQHLFSLQTKQKGTPRLYYLAADTEPDMAKWVHCLSNVCGLNPEAQGSPISEQTPSPTVLVPVAPVIDLVDASATPPPPPVRIDSIIGSNEYSPSPRANSLIQRSLATAATVQAPSHDPESYIPLEECSTGVTNMRLDDRSTSPIRESYSSHVPSTYRDRSSATTDSINGDIYDTPPARDGARALSERDSVGSDSMYQVPPVRTPSHCIRPTKHEQHLGASSRDSELVDYDVPPLALSPSGLRPVRPPKPSSVMRRGGGDSEQDPLHDSTQHPLYEQDTIVGLDGRDDDTYDLPRAVITTVDSRHLPGSPPPCDGGNIDVSVHKYVNAGLAVVLSPTSGQCSDFPKVDDDADADDEYSIPPAPVVVDDIRRVSAVGVGEGMYSSPRSLAGQQQQPKRAVSLNQPAPLPGRPFKPKQLRESHTGSTEGTYVTPVTRASVTYSKLSSPTVSLLVDSIPLPTKTGAGADGSDSSNDDDDDDDSNSSSSDTEATSIYQAPRPAATAPQRPAAAAVLQKAAAGAAAGAAQHAAVPHPSGVEYLDIAHDMSTDNHSPLPSRSASFGNQAGISSGASSATEYTDIDRVKTKALETTKKDLEATKKDQEARKCSEKE